MHVWGPLQPLQRDSSDRRGRDMYEQIQEATNRDGRATSLEPEQRRGLSKLLVSTNQEIDMCLILRRACSSLLRA